MRTAKETIIEAFLQLLYKKNFDEISVKDIVQKAGISRSTFYLHFADKYELKERVREELNERFLSFYRENTIYREKPITFYLCEHIFKYRSFYEGEFADANEVRKLSKKLASYLQKAFGDHDYAIFASYGTIGYLSSWVQDGFVISPGEAAERLLKIGFTNWANELSGLIE